MRLMRNNPKRNGLCKYAVIRLDKLDAGQTDALINSQSKKAELATIILNNLDLIEFGMPGDQEEFFAIKLKDVNAYKALVAYAASAGKNQDEQLASDVRDLANRSSVRSSYCKKPN